jgi:hypothetical protein
MAGSTTTIEKPRYKVVFVEKRSWIAILEAPKGILADVLFMASLLRNSGWRNGKEQPRYITGTALVYEAPDVPFEKFVITPDKAKFMVPDEHIGKKNHAFVLKHPDITVEVDNKDGLFLIKGGIVNVIENFPNNNGFYKTDLETGIPQGKKVSSSDPDARHLWRSEGSYIGPSVLVSSLEFLFRRYFYVDRWDDDAKVVWLNNILAKPKRTNKARATAPDWLETLRNDAEVAYDAISKIREKYRVGETDPNLEKVLALIRNVKGITLNDMKK